MMVLVDFTWSGRWGEPLGLEAEISRVPIKDEIVLLVIGNDPEPRQFRVVQVLHRAFTVFSASVPSAEVRLVPLTIDDGTPGPDGQIGA